MLWLLLLVVFAECSHLSLLSQMMRERDSVLTNWSVTLFCIFSSFLSRGPLFSPCVCSVGFFSRSIGSIVKIKKKPQKTFSPIHFLLLTYQLQKHTKYVGILCLFFYSCFVCYLVFTYSLPLPFKCLCAYRKGAFIATANTFSPFLDSITARKKFQSEKLAGESLSWKHFDLNLLFFIYYFFFVSTLPFHRYLHSTSLRESVLCGYV